MANIQRMYWYNTQSLTLERGERGGLISVVFLMRVANDIVFTSPLPFQDDQRDPQHKVPPLNVVISKCQHVSDRLNELAAGRACTL
jgi:hypothetical protein